MQKEEEKEENRNHRRPQCQKVGWRSLSMMLSASTHITFFTICAELNHLSNRQVESEKKWALDASVIFLPSRDKMDVF